MELAAYTLRLITVIRAEDVAQLDALLHDVQLDATDSLNYNWQGTEGTPLHVAAFLGKESMVAYLLRHGADPNARNGDGDTPLHKAALVGNLRIVYQLLACSDIDVEAKNNKGQTVLQLATEPKVILALECLLILRYSMKRVCTSL